MKRNFAVVLILFTILIAACIPINVYGDMGPKPSINIEFKNMGNDLCYCTLLSKDSRSGPHWAWEETPDGYRVDDLEDDIWQAFVDYKDEDGFYFLQFARQCNETKQFAWTYYPPQTFKILLYYPATKTFVSSEIYETYAFDSYYNVDMKVMSSSLIIAKKNYKYGWEIFSLFMRIIITVAIEIGLAFAFRLKGKKVLTTIIITNVTTQILLNVALNIINFYLGSLTFSLLYILFEFFIVIIEIVAYLIIFQYVCKVKVPIWKTILYALSSNICSFAAGFLAAIIIPGIL